jgi:hypothetical protein
VKVTYATVERTATLPVLTSEGYDDSLMEEGAHSRHDEIAPRHSLQTVVRAPAMTRRARAVSCKGCVRQPNRRLRRRLKQCRTVRPPLSSGQSALSFDNVSNASIISDDSIRGMQTAAIGC